MTLQDEDDILIMRLRRQAEADGLTRDQYQRRVSQEIDERGYDADRRIAIFDEARRQALASPTLLPDRVADDHVTRAQAILRDAGRRLGAAPWRRQVAAAWPAAIAHELERLLDELDGRPDGRDGRHEPSVEASLLQLRDLFEVLIKLSAIILARGLVEAGGEPADWARRALFTGTGSTGAWLGLLRDACRRAAGLGAPYAAISRGWQGTGLAAADAFVTLRNDLLGHGSRALDPRDIAQAIAGCLTTGEYRTTRGAHQRIRTLMEACAALTAAGAFTETHLVALADGGEIELNGAGATERWLADPAHATHDAPDLPVELRWAGGALRLSPLVTARICSQCNRRDILVYDALKSPAKGGIFDLLDYARGHKSRLTAVQAPDLADMLGDQAAEPPALAPGSSTSQQSVIEALDKARVDRDYLPPTYLREAFSSFLGQAEGGVFWLTAPAHVGKTTFVQGLVEPGLDDAPIDPRFAPGAGGCIVAYLCRKEHRVGLKGFASTVADQLRAAYNIGPNEWLDRPDEQLLVDQPSPETFARWLTDWQDFVRRLRRVASDAPLIVAIDGLDEAEPPGRSTPLTLLPPAALLPAGVYLLLTSRPPGEDDAPTFLGTHVAPLYADLPAAARFDVRLDSPAYQGLLDRYITGRLGLDEANPDDAALAEQVVATAERRFAYVSFLVDRIDSRGRNRVNLAGNGGAALYADYLAGLDRESGRKIADGLREVFVTLAAAEACHDHVFNAGRIIDLATGGVLTSLDQQHFAGLPVDVLATLIHHNIVRTTEQSGGIDPFLLLLLEMARGALRVRRAGVGVTRFTLGLKDFGAAVAQDSACRKRLPTALARIATLGFDSAEAISEGAHDDRAWENFQVIAPLLQSAVLLSESQILAKRFDTADLAGLVEWLNDNWKRSGYTTPRIPWLTLACAWRSPLPGTTIDNLSPLRRNDLAGAYMNRGNAKQAADGHGPGAAIRDYDLAIDVMERLRDALRRLGDDAWTPEYRNNLAAAYMNRGTAKQAADGHGPGAAIRDYDLAIDVRERLRDALRRLGDDAWTPEYRNNLANAYMNRGNAKRAADGHGPGAAIRDYDLAIDVRERLRDALRRLGDDAWTPEYRNDLANAYMNRGNAKQAADGHGPGAAIRDYDLAIDVMERLRDALRRLGDDAWTPEYRNDLAAAYMNRGNAKQAADGHGPGAAIRDYDLAIDVRERLRDALRRLGDDAWTPEYRNDLAAAYMNRGTAKQAADGHGPGAAIRDYDLAIDVMERLRDALRRLGDDAWTPEYRNDLANAYMNRGTAKQAADGHGPGAAIRDYDLAIDVMERLRDALRRLGDDAWTPEYRNDLANAYMNRGTAKQAADGHGPGAAIRDYDLAIDVRERLRDALRRLGDDAWTPEYRNDLAAAYMNRGTAKQAADGHGPGAAIRDYDLAIDVRERLRDALRRLGDDAWTPEYRNNLALAYLNRGRAYAQSPETTHLACRDLTSARHVWIDLVHRAPGLAVRLAGIRDYADRLARQLNCGDTPPAPVSRFFAWHGPKLT